MMRLSVPTFLRVRCSVLPAMVLAMSLVACTTTAQAPAPEPARGALPTPTNTAIARRASGTYRYESIKDGSIRGEERWQFFAHPDGSRTMIMWHDLAARNAQFSVVLRVAETFRPLEAYVSYWNGGAFKGSALMRVEGSRLSAQSSGPSGARNEAIDVPDAFSIGTHPVAGDGWHTWTTRSDTRGVQSSTLYGMEASADLTKPVLGKLTSLSIEYLGAETVVVPAGQFETLHVRIAGVNDLWITPRDRLVVKSVIGARDLQYVLVQVEGTLQ